ncbi:MAG: S8/S53 family peptidase [Paracoccaceae bacterium]
MADDITFSGPENFASVNATLLPWNYLTHGLLGLIGRSDGQSRIVMALPDEASGLPATYAAIGADTLSNPTATIDYIEQLDMQISPAAPPRCFLGPVTDLKPFEPGQGTPREIFPITGESWALIYNTRPREAVVIIDAGIAFWNRRFFANSGPRFCGVRYLDFDLPNIGQSNHLNEVDIEALCKLADREGSASVMRHLGGRFPKSFFGAVANPDPDGVWHGTAVADLAAGALPGEADHVALFGLELPRAVVADYSGEILTATLALILPAAIAMTKDFAGTPLTIVMPLGFPGGPQDGSHPAALAITKALAASGRENVRIVLPAGNHLQDRCRAKLPGNGSGRKVFWELPPDDYSINQVEYFGPMGQSVDLRITPPGQPARDCNMEDPETFRYVSRNDERIGILMRFVDGAGRSWTRLALWQTAASTAGMPVPHGRWAQSVAGNGALDLWVLRDDRDLAADMSRPRRPSRLWDPQYLPRNPSGARPLTDDPAALVRRSGTLSVLATAVGGGVTVVQANERLGEGRPHKAGYSGRREDGADIVVQAMVDDGWPGRGAEASANGSGRRVRMSGTSAAAGISARVLVGL